MKTKRNLLCLAGGLAVAALGGVALSESVGSTPKGPQGQPDFWNYDARTGKKVANTSPGLGPRELGRLYGVPAVHVHAGHGSVKKSKSPTLATRLAVARLATAKYATNLARAKADGYGIITRMIPDMGYHFLNPKITGFDVRKPAISSTCGAAGRGSSAPSSGCSPRSRPSRRCRGRATGRSARRATTPTGRSHLRIPRQNAGERAPSQERPSASGIPRS
jgi:hypothetical protein